MGQGRVRTEVWREDFIGQPLRVRQSPLLDPFLVERYRDSARESLELKLIRSAHEIDSWFDRNFLNASLKELKLEHYWPAYAADGKLLQR